MCEFTPRELIMAAPCRSALRRLSDDWPGRTASAGESLPADQVDLRLPRRKPILFWGWPIWSWRRRRDGKKMYELLGESKPMHVLELTQKCDDGDALRHWRSELDKLKGVLKRLWHHHHG